MRLWISYISPLTWERLFESSRRPSSRLSHCAYSWWFNVYGVLKFRIGLGPWNVLTWQQFDAAAKGVFNLSNQPSKFSRNQFHKFHWLILRHFWNSHSIVAIIPKIITGKHINFLETSLETIIWGNYYVNKYSWFWPEKSEVTQKRLVSNSSLKLQTFQLSKAWELETIEYAFCNSKYTTDWYSKLCPQHIRNDNCSDVHINCAAGNHNKGLDRACRSVMKFWHPKAFNAFELDYGHSPPFRVTYASLAYQLHEQHGQRNCKVCISTWVRRTSI